jgi:hypothetical protein
MVKQLGRKEEILIIPYGLKEGTTKKILAVQAVLENTFIYPQYFNLF